MGVGSAETYALDTISFPGFCVSYEEIQGWSQSHYVHLIVKHHVIHFHSNPSSTLSMFIHTCILKNQEC